MEQALVTAIIRRQMVENARGPSTRAANSDVLWIPAEVVDVLLHPLQSFPLVVQAIVD